MNQEKLKKIIKEKNWALKAEREKRIELEQSLLALYKLINKKELKI